MEKTDTTDCKRVAIYVRVSTQEQKKHGLSVDSQIVALTDFCHKNGYIISNIYNDAGISARKKYTARPALLQLLQDCEAGKIDLIIFTRLDRWFRNVANYYAVQERLDACHVPWRAIWEDYSTETSDGVFKVNIMLSIAQAEADRTSEKIKSVLEYKRDNGLYVGSAPTGYKIQNGHLVKDGNIKAVQTLFDTYLRTYSTSESMKAYERESGIHISYKQARDMLKNETYAGNAKGSKCEGYITMEQHDEIVSVMLSRVRAPKNPDTIYLFSGLVRCGLCGGSCSAKTRIYRNVGKNGITKEGESKVYRCSRKLTKYTCAGTMISESRLERYLLENLDSIIDDYNISVVNKVAIDHEAEIAQLEARLKRLLNLYEDGDINRDEYREKRDSCKRKIADLQAVQNNTEPVSLPHNWREMYDALTPINKKLFWKRIISKVVAKRGRNFGMGGGAIPEIHFRV